MKMTRDDNGVTIRPVEPLDLDFIQNLSKKVFSQYGPYDKILTDWFQSGTTMTRLALTYVTPVGFAMVKIPDEDQVDNRLTELLAIAVEPEKQNCGIGDLLMTDVLRLADKMQVEGLTLCTGVDNTAAQEFFKKHGFSAWRIEKDYYEGGQEALMMYKIISRDVELNGV